MDEPISAKTTAQQSKGPSRPTLCCPWLVGSGDASCSISLLNSFAPGRWFLSRSFTCERRLVRDGSPGAALLPWQHGLGYLPLNQRESHRGRENMLSLASNGTIYMGML